MGFYISTSLCVTQQPTNLILFGSGLLLMIAELIALDFTMCFIPCLASLLSTFFLQSYRIPIVMEYLIIMSTKGSRSFAFLSDLRDIHEPVDLQLAGSYACIEIHSLCMNCTFQ